MRRALLLTVSLAMATSALAGKPAPLTVKDISLMLRSGYSSEQVQAELTTRHFMGTLDEAGEKTLFMANASRQLILGLKSGTYAISPAELAAAEAEAAAKAKARPAQLQDSRSFDTLYQDQLAREKAFAAAKAPLVASAIAPMVKGDLVSSRNGTLTPYLDQEFEKKQIIGLYFSAQWCGPCRKFTPELVAFYNRTVAAHPEFEILFVSFDRSGPGMEKYMRDMQMPWPAVSFDKLPGKETLKKYAGESIPCLVIVDANGKVISDSYAGKTYRGPAVVLSELDQLLNAKRLSPFALKRRPVRTPPQPPREIVSNRASTSAKPL
jgi:nucleoredoxin